MKSVKHVALLMLIALTFFVQAAPVHFSFSGTAVDINLFGAQGPVTVGDTFSGILEVDYSAVDFVQDAMVGHYLNAVNISAKLSSGAVLKAIGGQAIVLAPVGYLSLGAGTYFGGVVENSSGLPVLPSPLGPYGLSALGLTIPSSSPFASDSIPQPETIVQRMLLPNADADFDFFNDVNDLVRVRYRIDGFNLISTVPEPQAYAVMLAGIFLVVAAARRRHRV